MAPAGAVVGSGWGGWAEVEGLLFYAFGEEGFCCFWGVGAREESLGYVLFWGWWLGHFRSVWLLGVVMVGKKLVMEGWKKMSISLSVGPYGIGL